MVEQNNTPTPSNATYRKAGLSKSLLRLVEKLREDRAASEERKMLDDFDKELDEMLVELEADPLLNDSNVAAAIIKCPALASKTIPTKLMDFLADQGIPRLHNGKPIKTFEEALVARDEIVFLELGGNPTPDVEFLSIDEGDEPLNKPQP